MTAIPRDYMLDEPCHGGPNACHDCGTQLDGDEDGDWCPRCEGFDDKCEACSDDTSDLVDRGGLLVCTVPCNAEDARLVRGA